MQKKKSTKMGNKEKTCQSLNKILIFLNKNRIQSYVFKYI